MCLYMMHKYLRIKLEQDKVVVIILGTVLTVEVVLAKFLVQCLRQIYFLPWLHLVKDGSKVDRETVTKHALHEDPDDLDVHPGHVGISVMGLAPSHERALHSIDLDLELFAGHSGSGGLRGIPREVTHDEPLVLAELHEVLLKVDLLSALEVAALVVSCLVLSLQDSHGVQNALSVAVHFLHRPWNDRRSTRLGAIDVGAEVNGLAELARIAAPVRATVPDHVAANGLDGLFEGFLHALRDGDEEGFEVFRIDDLDVAHDVLVQGVIQIGDEKVPALLALGFRQLGFLFGIRRGELLQFFLDGRGSACDQRNQLFQRPAVWVFGAVPGKLLDVACWRNASNGKVGIFVEQLVSRPLYLSHNVFNDAVGLSEVVAQVHESVQGSNGQ
mmetsp:Transcript_21937/g.62475  ORF Transcript_21937/g.62475 Transcript_21937/m.62475 type:complete len:386 (-) Transcript_21937:239-1396(-)